MATLRDLRQALGRELGECLVGTVQSATATTLVDPALAEARPEAGGLSGAWVLVVSGAQAGTSRRVSGYDPGRGTLTLGRAWTPPAPGDAYEVHTLASPEELARWINQGLGRCWYLRSDEIPVVADQRQYDLSALAWLRRPAQVFQVLWRLGDPGAYTYAPAWWYIRRGEVRAGGETPPLRLDVEPLPGSDTLVVQGVAYYGSEAGETPPLQADDDETLCDLRWAVAAAVVEAYIWLARGAPAQDVARYDQQLAKAAATFRGLCRRLGPRPALRLERATG